MKLNTSSNIEYLYDVHYAPVSSTGDIRKILNDKSVIKGEVVSVALTSGNQVLITYKFPVEKEKQEGIKLETKGVKNKGVK